MKKLASVITGIILILSIAAYPAYSAEVSAPQKVSPKVISPRKNLTKRAKDSSKELPSSYSSRDLGFCSSVKDQVGQICWAYGSLSSYESFMLKNNLYTADYDPSILDRWGANSGGDRGWMRNLREAGSTYIPIGNFTSWQGPLSQEGDTVKYGVTDISYFTKGDNEYIKRAIMESGAVTANLMDYSRGYSTDRCSYCITDKINHNSGHTISVVGWDDNYSKENFDGNYMPKNNGAWLCKNSAGQHLNSLGGYMWVSYEDYYLFSSEEYDPSFSIDKIREIGENDHLYQNEIYGATYEFNYIPEDDLTYFNVFDFSENGNVLEKVVFETLALGADYKIYAAELDEDGKPVSDKALWTELGSGKVEHNGYISCDTGNKILRRGKVAIGVELDTSSTLSENCLGVSEWLRIAETSTMFFIDPVEKGMSYVLYSGGMTDVKDYYADKLDDDIGGALVIKAITNEKTDASFLGDVDLNGDVNIKDVTALQKYLAQIITLPTDAVLNADFNQDGKIKITDATAISKMLAKIE